MKQFEQTLAIGGSQNETIFKDTPENLIFSYHTLGCICTDCEVSRSCHYYSNKLRLKDERIAELTAKIQRLENLVAKYKQRTVKKEST